MRYRILEYKGLGISPTGVIPISKGGPAAVVAVIEDKAGHWKATGVSVEVEQDHGRDGWFPATHHAIEDAFRRTN
tara:strand:+ start:2947 stop:3171 length:225 start_codon:yes stop_codon:yes gene_type:complete